MRAQGDNIQADLPTAELSYFLSSVSNIYAVKCRSPDLETAL